MIFELTSIRTEISFYSFSQLRLILAFYEKNNLFRINIPCKNNLKKDFLLNSIKIAREEFPNINIIPHFSIFHEFRNNRLNTINSFIYFLQVVNKLGCNEVLLVSGSKERATLNSVSTLEYLKGNNLFSFNDLSIGVAFNPYLTNVLFDQEIVKLEKKIESGLVKSIWIQFGTDITILESRIKLLKQIILSNEKSNINLYGSILIPSKQFLARFRYRPWKGINCSQDFLGSIEYARYIIKMLLKTYKKYDICPIIETDLSTDDKLNTLKTILQL